MQWSVEQLAGLPREDGFRLRGQQVTRLETFVDAAFAFALTLLVIFFETLPTTYDELREALRRVPTFIMCFVLLAMFWSAHNRWSRRFGLDDFASTIWSLGLVLVMLVYVYPLRMVVSSGLWLATGGFVPTELVLTGADAVYDLLWAFIIYGFGFGAMALMIWLLNRHALGRAAALGLDAVERHEAGTEAGIQAILAGSAALSIAAAFALLALPREQFTYLISGLPMFFYPLLGFAIPAYGAWRARRRPEAA
ncbi:TMEM175 family protein [Arenimonas donghaensis]|uniref:TMEM175 family protein n=1 Tax=Arenimonas donghaensis TaxID=375061 RepID=UPI0013630967|nr:TMEM175 family protein [Arenimonas donghaensis]